MMIGRLQGKLVVKQPSWIILDIQGVGYEITLPLSVFASLPAVDEPLTLWIHQVIREDANLLYGFARLEDRQLFRELVKVTGIGPKVGIAIMSAMASSALLQAVQNEDLQALTRIPGIGKKTAERLLIDLRDRLKAWQPQQMARLELEDGVEANFATALPVVNPIAEAESALVALGYKLTEASRAIAAVAVQGMDTQDLIRAALKGMAK
ncbi:MAG TPA: Holliday junction branch migration protein RuvA [Marinospirillum sp.]|uniref:Holliday junction branch migration protein RuvA n=1 Tax=Marinospirillum sp. TaxID=2183934 RepID=UPI002B4A0A3B|nr:Holliday junction branch migration protein RuvA [Marinospirillum sp.]HKM15344.1 Holliday junction branch migration protein RuvA [Marinospirillum sp.]